VGLGLATIGMVTGIVIGTMLVNYAVKSPTISIALDNRTSPEEGLDIDHHLPKPGDAPMDEWNGMTPVTGAAVFIGVSLVTGIVLHETFRRVFHVIGSDFFDKFPLFPFAIVGGVLVQIAAVRYKFRVGRQPASPYGLARLSSALPRRKSQRQSLPTFSARVESARSTGIRFSRAQTMPLLGTA